MNKYQTSVSLLLVVIITTVAGAQNAAPSSHFVFNDRGDGDIIINEVRVPKGGEAMYTYYETLGWGGSGAGYAGIQVHPRARNFIFSIWDHKSHTAPISAIHHGPGTETKGFGGEGTGLKSWNFELGWSTDVWYTLVSRCWPVGDHTYYGFWVRAGDTGRWTHLVTMDVAAKDAYFRGATDAFLEDWVNSGVNARTTNLRGCWKRIVDGTWIAATEGRYSVNYWDLTEGKRSYNYRTAWNGGVAKDDTGEYYFMTSGGADTKPTTANPSTFKIDRTEKTPPFETIAVKNVTSTVDNPGTLRVKWETDATRAPQFSCLLEVYDNRTGEGDPVASLSVDEPHKREAALDVPSRPAEKQYFLHLKCTDIFDRESAVSVVVIGMTEVK